MTTTELIANLRSMEKSGDPQICFLYLAAHAEDIHLRDGTRLLDLTDFKICLTELADALAPRNGHAHQVEATCPRCGHTHEGSKECGAEIGGGRLCRCEMEVPALQKGKQWP